MTPTEEINKNPDNPTTDLPWYKKRWAINSYYIAGTIVILYGLVFLDVRMRAKESYLEGEKYMRWHNNPSQKKIEVDAKFEQAKKMLDKKFEKKKIAQEEYDRQLEIIQFDRERAMEESSIKYAYVWYQTAYELFSPPESKWVMLSREKAPVAKELWKKELKSQNIPFEDYMLE